MIASEEKFNCPIAIFKIGQEDHMNDLLYNGHVYMKPLSYFTNLENKSPKADPEEGTRFCLNADGAVLKILKNKEWKKLGTIQGGIRHRDRDLGKVNLYCLHAKMQNDYGKVFELNQLEFGDYYVLFTDWEEFLQRFYSEINKQGHEIRYGLVNYVDMKSYSGTMGIFRKFSEHSIEQEMRLAILPGTGKPLLIRLGDLSDIAIMGKCSDRLKLEHN